MIIACDCGAYDKQESSSAVLNRFRIGVTHRRQERFNPAAMPERTLWLALNTLQEIFTD